jgi:hypothetical protein
MTIALKVRRAVLGTAAVAFGLTLGLQEADAISTYDPTSMTCAAVKSAIRANGKVMLRWRSRRTGNPLYGQYVANRNYCDTWEVTTAKSVPASDRSNCSVRKCIPRSYIFDDDRCFFNQRC